jgi:glutathione S-transferase
MVTDSTDICRRATGPSPTPCSAWFVFARFGKRDPNWAENKRALFGRLPPVVRHLVPPSGPPGILKQLRGHGMGRHTEAEIYELGRQDPDSLSDHLGERPWFMGDTPTTLDASAFGLLANILFVPIESPLKAHLNTRANLVAFCERVRERYYPRAAGRTVYPSYRSKGERNPTRTISMSGSVT